MQELEEMMVLSDAELAARLRECLYTNQYFGAVERTARLEGWTETRTLRMSVLLLCSVHSEHIKRYLEVAERKAPGGWDVF